MSIYADEGTAAHQVLEECLRLEYEAGMPVRASDYVGNIRRIENGPHSRLSPSSAKRWMTCPGSVAMEDAFPELPQSPRDIEVTPEMAEAVQVCLDYVAQRVQDIQELTPDGVVKVIPERRVSPEKLIGTRDCDGTSDITLQVWRSGNLEFVEQIDYKHGAGVPVYADDPQNRLYLLGTLAQDLSDGSLYPDSARVTIVQPRCDKIDPVIRYIDLGQSEDDTEATVGEWVANFVVDVIAAIEATEHDDAPLVASEDGCRFCSARGACREYLRFAMAEVGVISEEDQLPTGQGELFDVATGWSRIDNRLLTADQIIQALDAKEVLVGALDAIEAFARQMCIDGTAPQALLNAYKLVHGRAIRRWAQGEDETFRLLRKIKGVDPETGKTRAIGKKDVYRQALVSAPQAEKILKNMRVGKTSMKAFQTLIDKPEGGLTLVPVSDPRPRVIPEPKPTPEESFAGAPEAPEKPA